MNRTERATRALFDTINDRELGRIRDLVTEDFVDHGAPPNLVPPGPDGYITVMEFVTGYGLHRSDHLGVPATGRPYAMPSMHLCRGDGDRLAEHWGVRDELSVLYQVGALTPGPLPSLVVD